MAETIGDRLDKGPGMATSLAAGETVTAAAVPGRLASRCRRTEGLDLHGKSQLTGNTGGEELGGTALQRLMQIGPRRSSNKNAAGQGGAVD